MNKKESIVEYVNEWQKNPLVHSLTCGVDSMHEDLVAVEVGEKVILKCPTCGYRQDLPSFMRDFFDSGYKKEI